jgi:hypothetical protein
MIKTRKAIETPIDTIGETLDVDLEEVLLYVPVEGL